ncbi:MAG: MogA/MoaB family molybdenum cofactor biosynthesis protein [Thermoprotei archaeon]
MSAHKKHKELAPAKLNYYVITISTSRYEKLVRKEPVVDESGDLIKEMLIRAGQNVVGYDLVPDDKVKILKAFAVALDREDVDVVISSGGTGYSPTDVTVETIRPLFDRHIEGFSDLFRLYSEREIGGAAYLTKASAGVINGKLIYLLPGSPDAVKLALEKLILPEAGHLVFLIRSPR